jgi:hypothetical protein
MAGCRNYIEVAGSQSGRAHSDKDKQMVILITGAS